MWLRLLVVTCLGCSGTSSPSTSPASAVAPPPGTARDEALAAEPPASPAETEPTEPAAPVEPARDPADPATLVHAVFRAIVAGDAQAYLKLTMSEPEDFEDLAKLRTHPPEAPSPEKMATYRQVEKTAFERFIIELRTRGLDPQQARLVEVKTDKAMVREGLGFAEDLTAVVEQGGLRLPITLDDCVLTRRGWLVTDGLKLRE